MMPVVTKLDKVLMTDATTAEEEESSAFEYEVHMKTFTPIITPKRTILTVRDTSGVSKASFAVTDAIDAKIPDPIDKRIALSLILLLPTERSCSPRVVLVFDIA